METARKIYDDTRKRRTRTLWGEATYHEVAKGLGVDVVRRYKVPGPEIRKIMQRTVKAFLDGKIEPFKIKKVGHNIAARRVHGYSFQTDHPRKKGLKCWMSAECKLEMRYLLSVLYHGRDDQNEALDWETGEPVKPWITASASDGSAVYLWALMEDLPDDEDDTDDTDDTDDPVNEGEESSGPKKKKKKKKRREE
jgi:hypothetical protein